MRSVVGTGLGEVTPLGRSVEDSWAKLCAGRSGIRPMTQFDVSGLRTRVAGQVPDFAPEAYMTAKLAGRVDRFVQLGVAAARQAVQHARLTVAGAEAERVAVVMGNTFAGVLLVEQGCCTAWRSEEHTSELQSQSNLVCRLLLEKTKHCDARYTVAL